MTKLNLEPMRFARGAPNAECRKFDLAQDARAEEPTSGCSRFWTEFVSEAINGVLTAFKRVHFARGIVRKMCILRFGELKGRLGTHELRDSANQEWEVCHG